jgi:predicted DNA-binding transcriptional regulator AlpA
VTDRPDLAALLADPTRVPVEQIPDAIGELERAKAVLWARLTTPVSTNGGGEDRLLTAEDVSQQTTLSLRWLYRHADALPFTRRVGRKVLFSSAGLAKWLATRRP